MSFPKISIITPSYNQGEYLEQTIDSVLSQNYPNLEYFVFDGGSTDNSVEVIKKYEKHITYWESQKDKGQSDAINKGLVRSTGEIINWLNSDDYYEKDTFQIITEKFKEKPKTLAFLGKSRLFEGNKTVNYSQGTDIYPNNLAKTIGWARIDQPETFFHASAVQKMGLLDTNLHYLMDRDWWMKFLFYFGLENVTKTDDILVNFRLHESSKTVSQSADFEKDSYKYYANLARMHDLLSYAEFLEEEMEFDKTYYIKNLEVQDKSLVEQILNYYILLRGNEFYAQNITQKAKKYLNFVKKEFLYPEEQKLLQKLKMRNNYIPKFLINLMRKA